MSKTRFDHPHPTLSLMVGTASVLIGPTATANSTNGLTFGISFLLYLVGFFEVLWSILADDHIAYTLSPRLINFLRKVYGMGVLIGSFLIMGLISQLSDWWTELETTYRLAALLFILINVMDLTGTLLIMDRGGVGQDYTPHPEDNSYGIL